MEQSLRILAIVNLPWDPRLGAVRVWFELSEQWKKAGHKVDKFCLSDAFPNPIPSPARYAWRQTIFAYRAARFIRRHRGEFDVIDCLIGALPFSKTSLGFDGLLVGRSVGLHLAYMDFIRSSQKRWQDEPRGKFFGRLFYTTMSWLLQRSADRALVRCDCFNVPNEDEKRALERHRPGTTIIVQPYGLNDLERLAFVNSARSPSARLARKEICFLGMWSIRKGSRDWPEIVRTVWNSIPDARFAFLGTMTDEQTILRDLGLSARESIRCVTSYDPEDLPQLINNCAVGLFPSYVEGFGLSVIEQLAAGIPTIAYDVPGPRHIFATDRASFEFLVPAGGAKTMAERAIEILRMQESDYAALSVKCRQIASAFRWEQIAAETIREYTAAIEQLNVQPHNTRTASA
jgi:glycosyltransferase involved in cell wall biosynthesis